ncbi:MAG: hypothetical protein ACYCVB_13660 [Bacilli bacterium]
MSRQLQTNRVCTGSTDITAYTISPIGPPNPFSIDTRVPTRSGSGNAAEYDQEKNSALAYVNQSLPE